jgi:hypothetical protein
MGWRRTCNADARPQAGSSNSDVIRVEPSKASIAASGGRHSKRLAASRTRGSRARSPAVSMQMPGRPSGSGMLRSPYNRMAFHGADVLASGRWRGHVSSGTGTRIRRTSGSMASPSRSRSLRSRIQFA